MRELNNRAQGHVEIILSFVIFIGFLLFIFIFMNPFAKTKETSHIMDNIQKSIINEISGDVGKLSVVVNEGKNCYYFSNDYGINYAEDSEANKKYMIT